jgi:uncharacterized protein (DUF486 family)
MPAQLLSPHLLPILLLIGSNIFMTQAWYGHLRFKEVPLGAVILAAWAIAFVEYCMAVPTNRWGSAVYTTAQLKTMQEVITLLVFAGFSVLYLHEPIPGIMASASPSSPWALFSSFAARSNDASAKDPEFSAPVGAPLCCANGPGRTKKAPARGARWSFVREVESPGRETKGNIYLSIGRYLTRSPNNRTL